MGGCAQLRGGALSYSPLGCWVLGDPWGGICGVMPIPNRQVLGRVFPSLVPTSTRLVGAPEGHHEAALPTRADIPKLRNAPGTCPVYWAWRRRAQHPAVPRESSGWSGALAVMVGGFIRRGAQH